MASPVFSPATASILLNVFDGARRPIAGAVELLVRVRDGNQKEVHADFHHGPSLRFSGLRFFNNFGDDYTVVVSADDHVQAGFTPVRVSPAAEQVVDLMLLPKNARFNFRQAAWTLLEQTRPRLFQFLKSGAASEQAARDRYEQLMETGAPSLAGLLNITTALYAVHLPAGKPLDYFKELIWDDPQFPIQSDRFYAWADIELVAQVRRARDQGAFASAPGNLHEGATSSFKQVQFGEANVQLTFHENDTRDIGGTACIIVEPDIDYFRDPLAHLILEVVPNSITGGLTDPKSVYVLRWIAGRRAGVPEFDPLYSIEA